MDTDWLDLIRRIFDELLDEPLHSSVTAKNALLVIPILIDQMAARDATKSSGSYPTGSTPGNSAPRKFPKPVPLGADVTLNNKPSKTKLAAFKAEFMDACRKDHECLQDRVDLLLGKRK